MIEYNKHTYGKTANFQLLISKQILDIQATNDLTKIPQNDQNLISLRGHDRGVTCYANSIIQSTPSTDESYTP